MILFLSLMTLLLQACLSDQASVQDSLQQLQALGEQLKSQVDASSSAALQSDHLSLTHRLATLEHGLHRQQEVLQVGWKGNGGTVSYVQRQCMTMVGRHFCTLTVSVRLFSVWISGL